MINLRVGRQTYDFDCGAKALQTVMTFYGVEVRGDELMEHLKTDKNGTSISNMISVAQKYGFDVCAEAGWSIEKVKQTVNKNCPVIVVLQAWAERFMTLDDWRKDYDDGHYAIVIGHTNGIVVFEDPSSFRRTWLTEEEFLARWHDQDVRNEKIIEHFGMVLMGKKPVEPEPQHMD